MAYNPLNPNGQATMANSQPVVLASNQSSIATASSIIGLTPVAVTNTPSISGTVNIGISPGSTVVFQATSPWIITGSIQGGSSANQSVSGTVGASIIGNVPVVVQSSVAVAIVSGSITASFTPPANQSVSGTIQTDVRGSVATVIIGGSIAASFTPPANQSVSGTVTANQGTNPWIITGSVQGSFSPSANQSVSGTVQVDVRSSVAVAIISGSIAATFTPPANQSVSGTIQTDVRGSVATVIIGGSIAASFTPPANQSVSGTIVANQGTSPWIITGSIQGSFSPSGNQSVSGTVGASIIGLPPVNVTNFPTTQNVSGSVVASQGTSPWVVQSIVGTYAEDSASTDSDKGIFTLGVRNDAMSSLVSASGDYGAFALDSQGRTITKPFVSNDATLIEYTSSIVTTSVTLIQASAVGKRSYITDIIGVNSGSVATVIQIKDGSTSLLGTIIAPGGGGSNPIGLNLPFRTAPAQDLTFTPLTAVSVLYMTVRGYQGQ